MEFVVVSNMAPRNPSVCATCSRPSSRGTNWRGGTPWSGGSIRSGRTRSPTCGRA